MDPVLAHSAVARVRAALAAWRERWAAAGCPHTGFGLTCPELLRVTAAAQARLAR